MKLKQKLEALLFVSNHPAKLADLASATESTEAEVRLALDEMTEEFQRERGLQIVQIAGGYQLCTQPELATMIGQYLKPARNKLTRSQLEVLAVVAYQQPVTMAEIDAVRGVQSDHSLRVLLDRRLVKELGRRPTPGRPMLYGTSEQFLHLFKLRDLNDLPALNWDSLVAMAPPDTQELPS